MLFFCRLTLIAILGLCTGCATVFTGTTDTINVAVPDCQQATCKASNADGEWVLESIPGVIEVDKDRSALIIVCEAPGHESAAVSMSSSTEGWVWGNILIGGLIGLAVDLGTGGMYDYDGEVRIPMVCNQDSEGSISQR